MAQHSPTLAKILCISSYFFLKSDGIRRLYSANVDLYLYCNSTNSFGLYNIPFFMRPKLFKNIFLQNNYSKNIKPDFELFTVSINPAKHSLYRLFFIL